MNVFVNNKEWKGKDRKRLIAALIELQNSKRNPKDLPNSSEVGKKVAK